MENEKIVCKADIRYKKIMVLHIIWYIIGAIAFLWLTFGISEIEHWEGYDGFAGYWPEHDEVHLYIWGIWLYEKGYWFDLHELYGPYFNVGAIIGGIAITCAIIVWPFIIKKIKSKILNQCSLILTGEYVCGQVKTFFNNRKIQVPIEKIDNIMLSNTILDRLVYSGKTIIIHSNSGRIKFHSVQNAKEFTDATLAKIDEIKQAEKDRNNSMSASVTVQSESKNEAQSNAQKIKDLKELLEIGAISQEEFDVKRKELLEKF